MQQTAEQLIEKFGSFLESSGSFLESSGIRSGGMQQLQHIWTGLSVETIAQLIAHCNESLNSDTVASDALVRLLLLGAWLASSESKAATA